MADKPSSRLYVVARGNTHGGVDFFSSPPNLCISTRTVYKRTDVFFNGKSFLFTVYNWDTLFPSLTPDVGKAMLVRLSEHDGGKIVAESIGEVLPESTYRRINGRSL